MKIDDLRVFVRVADAGSLSLAAAQLGLAQPNVSRVIRGLERKLDAPLFNRTGRGVSLTIRGERFLKFALSTLEELQKTESDMRLLVGAAPKNLTIVIPRHTGRVLIPAIFRGFSAHLPNIHLDIVEMQSKDGSAALIEKSCDIAVFYDTTHSAFPDQHVLFRESLYLTGHEKYLSQFPDPITLGECAALPLLIFSNPPYAQMVEGAFEKADAKPTKIQYLENMVAMKAFAMEGQGVAIMAFSNIVSEFENKEIRAHRIVDPPIERNIMGAIGLHLDRSFANTALSLLKTSLAEIAPVARWRSSESFRSDK